MSTEVMARQTRRQEPQEAGQPPSYKEEQPQCGGSAHAGPGPSPARRGLPVCHREPDVPSYHLWGSVREICGERGQVGQAEGAVPGAACACDPLFEGSQPGEGVEARRPTRGQRNIFLYRHLVKGRVRLDHGGSTATFPLGPDSRNYYHLASVDGSEVPLWFPALAKGKPERKPGAPRPPLLHFLVDVPTGHQFGRS